MPEFLIEVDGSARNNPGPAGIGVRVVRPDGTVLREISRCVGVRTNNQAEYLALIRGLEEARRLGDARVVVRTDSELVARQLGGHYRVKNADLKPLHARAVALLGTLPRVRVAHVPREQNAAADRLAQDASGAGTAGDSLPS